MTIKRRECKVCSNCNKKLPIDSSFCQYCGSDKLFSSTEPIKIQKYCLKCGKQLPIDSSFCQYCGSDKLQIEEVNVEVNKVCGNCGRVLPEDSSFCQYCGSKEIIEEEQKSEISRQENRSKIIKADDNITKSKEVKKDFTKQILSSIAIVLLGVIIITSLEEYLGKSKIIPVNFSNGEIVEPNSSGYFTTNQNEGNKSNYYELTIKAPDDYNLFVLVDRTYYWQKISYLVKKGCDYSIWLKNGHYDIYVAFGDEWYGIDDLFGKETKCYKLEKGYTTSIDGKKKYLSFTFDSGTATEKLIEVEREKLKKQY